MYCMYLVDEKFKGSERGYLYRHERAILLLEWLVGLDIIKTRMNNNVTSQVIYLLGNYLYICRDKP